MGVQCNSHVMLLKSSGKLTFSGLPSLFEDVKWVSVVVTDGTVLVRT